MQWTGNPVYDVLKLSFIKPGILIAGVKEYSCPAVTVFTL
jgi:hypothetical protein